MRSVCALQHPSNQRWRNWETVTGFGRGLWFANYLIAFSFLLSPYPLSRWNSNGPSQSQSPIQRSSGWLFPFLATVRGLEEKIEGCETGSFVRSSSFSSWKAMLNSCDLFRKMVTDGGSSLFPFSSGRHFVSNQWGRAPTVQGPPESQSSNVLRHSPGNG